MGDTAATWGVTAARHRDQQAALTEWSIRPSADHSGALVVRKSLFDGALVTEPDRTLELLQQLPGIRRSRFPPEVTVAPSERLRRDLIGHAGAHLVREIFNALKLPEQRLLELRLEHKLVQAQFLMRWVPAHVPTTYGLSGLLRGRPDKVEYLRDVIAQGFLVKRALGHCSGDASEFDVSAAVLEAVRRCDLAIEHPCDGAEETFVVQERLAIRSEYRLHSFEDRVVRHLTFPRYEDSADPAGFCDVEATLQRILDALPGEFLCGSLLAWDLAETNDGVAIVEVNIAGFHPVFARGFQCSGFLQEEHAAAAAIARLLVHITQTYGTRVHFNFSERSSFASGRHIYFDSARFYRMLITDSQPGRSVMQQQHAGRSESRARTEVLDVVIPTHARDLCRVPLMLASMSRHLNVRHHCWLVVHDDMQQVGALWRRSAPCESSTVISARDLPDLGQLRSRAPSLGSWTQAVYLQASQIVRSHYYLIATPEAVAVRPVCRENIFDEEGRGVVFRHLTGVQRSWYRAAAQMLGIRPPRWTYEIPPVVLSTTVARDLLNRLVGCDCADLWRTRAHALYFAHLESTGTFGLYHGVSQHNLLASSVWQADELPSPSSANLRRTRGGFFMVIGASTVLSSGWTSRAIATLQES